MKTFAQRIPLCQNPAGQRLLSTACDKESRLGVVIDVTRMDDLLRLAKQLAPYACLIKTHIDAIEDFSWEGIEELRDLAEKEQCVLFEDRKFADIGHTVHLQYAHGIYRIAEWAPIVTVHAVPGPGIIEGLKQAGMPRGNGGLMLAQMSSQDNLATGAYTEKAVAMAMAHRDFIMGFISQRKMLDDPGMLTLTPGIKFNDAGAGDGLGQRYTSPEVAVNENSSDIILVGRGITGADDPASMAERYQRAAVPVD